MAVVSVLSSCASSKSTSTVLNGTDLSKYKYVVFGANSDGDAELEDIVMMVQNEISEKLHVVSAEKATLLLSIGEKVVSPKIEDQLHEWHLLTLKSWYLL